jgi:hypothetical protein
VLARVSPGYPPLPGRLPTCYSPVRRSPAAEATFAHDLHVLSTPPAFILSQDQTLQFRPFATQDRLDLKQLFVRNYTSRSAKPLSTRKHRKTQASSEAKPLTLLFLYLVFKEPTPRSRRRIPILLALSQDCQAPEAPRTQPRAPTTYSRSRNFASAVGQGTCRRSGDSFKEREDYSLPYVLSTPPPHPVFPGPPGRLQGRPGKADSTRPPRGRQAPLAAGSHLASPP